MKYNILEYDTFKANPTVQCSLFLLLSFFWHLAHLLIE
jgi:hypothetical protein